ncbi:DUF805 domain-containing protein [Stenotrophomonas maltophilia]|uniref:DUF805 domain-containing protein n=1 Tax=Stenotrophomonas maltophilia TaxID=40324 RepID=A0AAP7L0H2_STEMA|nr:MULTISPECIES: DUF805 domain-containing protein [Stenotrophomonas]HEC0958057.1 DUF805 domain-containing protein [Klebsiella pneumoniae]MBA0220022.1 DUF805 domain-containing protein [Stenotrophomonas maltophilia]MBE5271335.1 DUF805 domain-containing protein [Stenotrophomonas sp. B2]MBN4939974.1 DUF805 domain-containing protein [Stenotrophomonas maltophilia]MCO7397661.1 DUF805 domain-containing protein [Stenotrophomonas maltophilia]
MQDMTLALKRYAQFEGRANRREYWMFQLFLFLVATAVSLLAGVLAILMRSSPDALSAILIGTMVLLGLMWLATIVPLIAVTVRRLHDCNQSGWLYLLALVPMGGLVILVFALLPGTPQENPYGPVPAGP